MHRCLPVVMIALALAVASPLSAQDMPPGIQFASVQKLFEDRCSACHDWANSAKGILGNVTPGRPEQSRVWAKVSAGAMPPDGALAAEDQKLIEDWIRAGAPTTDAATSSAATGTATTETGSTSAAGTVTVATTAQLTSGFLGFPSKVAYHQAAGFTSSALFVGAGIVGAIQWATLISAAHAYRDANGIGEETMSPACDNYIMGLWNGTEHQALRWTHVGLLSAGEVLYLGNAATGISMITPHRVGLSAGDLHRYAFFTHATLMLSQLILGALTTTFLSQGNHWTMIAVGAAHTVIGFAIPTIMVSAGIAVNAGFPR
jgi:hypothetical protein